MSEAEARGTELSADKARALTLAPVSRETQARLDRFIDLLLLWQAKTNLVAPSTLGEIWTRHVADSLQLLRLAPDARRWLDLGSGGGFPGIVLGCVLADTGGRIDLVERNGKKAAFLREAIRVSGASAVVHPSDIVDYVDSSAQGYDCVTARALAPLQMLLQWVEPVIVSGARALFLKGQDVESELTEATKYWNIDLGLHPSLTGPGWIVDIRALERKQRQGHDRD